MSETKEYEESKGFEKSVKDRVKGNEQVGKLHAVFHEHPSETAHNEHSRKVVKGYLFRD